MTIAKQLEIEDFPLIIRDRRKVYVENADGYWCKRHYDERGNQIYFEDSAGAWEKSKYDSKDNMIYSEGTSSRIGDIQSIKPHNSK